MLPHQVEELNPSKVTPTITTRKLAVILGVPVDELNMEETLDRIEEFVEIGRATGKSHQVVTINADFVVNAINDPELRYLLQDADLATADGMPLVWGARLLNIPLQGRVAGADLVPDLAERAAKKGYSIYLLGAAPGVASSAGKILQDRFPGLKIAGVHSPPYSPVLEMEPSIMAEIEAARPDILMVAFGNPKQEKWIGMYKQQLKVPVMMGVGGSLDFIAGTSRRAPGWMQQVGLEWLFRLIKEPARLWRRYVSDLIIFSTFFARQWWVMQKGASQTELLPSADLLMVGSTAVIKVTGDLTINNFQSFNDLGVRALSLSPFVIVNMVEARFLDSAAIGSLVHFAKQAREAGGELALVAVQPLIRASLSLLRLDNFFLTFESIDNGLDALAAHKKNGAEAVHLQPDSLSVKTGGMTPKVVKGPRRFDASTASEVVKECSRLLASHPFIILDLSETVFLTSAGLAALAQLTRLAKERKGEFKITGYSQDVLKVIQMVRFDRVLALD